MTKNVFITVRGIRIAGEEKEKVEVTSPGSYYIRKGKHYLLYQETDDEGCVVSSTIRLDKTTMDLMRKGGISTHMVFEQGKKNRSNYHTPAGVLTMDVRTEKFLFEEREDLLEAELDYALEINGEHVSDCQMKVTVIPDNR